MLDVVGVEPDAALIDDWRARVERGRAFLGWEGTPTFSMEMRTVPLRGQSPVARVHADGASLAVAAPVDQLFTATELNEWALAATLLGIAAPVAADAPAMASRRRRSAEEMWWYDAPPLIAPARAGSGGSDGSSQSAGCIPRVRSATIRSRSSSTDAS